MRSKYFLFLSALLAACSANAPQEPASASTQAAVPGGFRRVAGMIAYHGDGPEIELPAFARAGVPFQMSVTTYGGGCVREAETTVDVRNMIAAVTPFQLEPAPGSELICTRELRIYPRPVTITFASIGRATVRIQGMTRPGDSTIVIERAIDVRQ